MGINKLGSYIVKYGNSSPITERVCGNKIYNSRVIYLDALSKLIEIYHQFLKSDEPQTYENLVNFEVARFSAYLLKISYYKRQIYVFIDYHYKDDIDAGNLLFEEYLPTPSSDFKIYERKNAYKYIEEIPEEELQFYKEVANPEKDTLMKVWYRYLVKIKCKEEICQKRRRLIEETEETVYEENIFRNFVHNIKEFISKLRENKDLSFATFYGCSIESDFAIVKHINSYNKNTYPIVITNDTDLIALLCDVDCVIKYVLTGKVYIINPPNFWKNVFGTELSSTIIKILCVLKGVDYNIVDRNNCLNTFSDILRILNVKSYNDITKEMLYEYLNKYFEINKNKEYIKYTALAINMYLVNMEITFYEI